MSMVEGRNALGRTFVAALVGGTVATGVGALVDLYSWPVARLGEPLIGYVARNAPEDLASLWELLILWPVVALGPAISVLVVSGLARRTPRDWRPWAMLGFGVPALFEFGVRIFFGRVTYVTGVEPQPAQELWWVIAANAILLGGIVAVAGAIALALANFGDARRARLQPPIAPE